MIFKGSQSAFTIILAGALSLNLATPDVRSPFVWNSADAAGIPCKQGLLADARPASLGDYKTKTNDHARDVISLNQITYDLCNAAFEVFPRAAPDPNLKTRDTLEKMMRTIALEGHLLNVCPTQKRLVEEPAELGNADYSELHEFGCGPYPKDAFASPLPISRSDARKNFSCQNARPTPTPVPSGQAILHSNHPPVTRIQASFDLCHAALVIQPMAPLQIERYLSRLMIEVHLALTCEDGRPANPPADTDQNFAETREFGCWSSVAPALSGRQKH